jgi:crossover junction endodeoxyribonuclease RuvC
LRVLGIDPGTSATGVGVVESLGDEARLLHASTLSPPRREALSLRLSFLYDELARTIEKWRPVEIAIERPFVARNVKSAMAIGQAQGIAMAAAGKAGLEIFGYEPRKVKQSITGHGGSTKLQVQLMVCASLGIDGLDDYTTDASDALAVALCHLSARRVSRLAVKD